MCVQEQQFELQCIIYSLTVDAFRVAGSSTEHISSHSPCVLWAHRHSIWSPSTSSTAYYIVSPHHLIQLVYSYIIIILADCADLIADQCKALVSMMRLISQGSEVQQFGCLAITSPTWNFDCLATAFLESNHWKHARYRWCIDKSSVGSLKKATTHSQLPSKAKPKEIYESTICVSVNITIITRMYAYYRA